jgi:hypothetical protein
MPSSKAKVPLAGAIRTPRVQVEVARLLELIKVEETETPIFGRTRKWAGSAIMT